MGGTRRRQRKEQGFKKVSSAYFCVSNIDYSIGGIAMNSPTLGLHLDLIKASTRAVASGHTCEGIAQAMRDYADALVNPPLALPAVPAFRTLETVKAATAHPASDA